MPICLHSNQNQLLLYAGKIIWGIPPHCMYNKLFAELMFVNINTITRTRAFRQLQILKKKCN